MKFQRETFGVESKDDCVPRALALAFDQNYEDMLTLCTTINRVLGEKKICPKSTGVDTTGVRAILHDYFGVGEYKNMSLDKIPRKGTFFLLLELYAGDEYQSHSTCIKDGVIIDSWDWRKLELWDIGEDYHCFYNEMLKNIKVWRVK